MDGDLVPAAVVLKGDVQRLVKVADPVAQELQRRQLVHRTSGRRRENSHIVLNSREGALGSERARIRGQPFCVAR
jgi:hypothetical protein